MNKFQLWLYKRAPQWIIVNGDPHRTFMRIISMILSLSPLAAIFMLLYLAVTHTEISNEWTPDQVIEQRID